MPWGVNAAGALRSIADSVGVGRRSIVRLIDAWVLVATVAAVCDREIDPASLPVHASSSSRRASRDSMTASISWSARSGVSNSATVWTAERMPSA